MSDFATDFNANIDTGLLQTLGDVITFLPANGSVITAKCVTVSKGEKASSWVDDIIARLDTRSILLLCLSSDVQGVVTSTRVNYQSKNWVVSNILEQDDGTTMVVINPGNYAAAGGWQ
jgi:hypothetical protein